MNSARQTPVFRKKRLTAFRGRGDLYSWLRAHHKKVATGLERGDLTWPTICAEMARHGVASRDGLPPSQRAAAKAWCTVRRDLEAEGKGVSEARKCRPSPARLPRDWRPESAATSALASRPTPPPSSDDEPYDWRKRMAQLRRTINERSGRRE